MLYMAMVLKEDIEALSSNNYLKRIAKARKEKGGFTLKQLKKKYKIISQEKLFKKLGF